MKNSNHNNAPTGSGAEKPTKKARNSNKKTPTSMFNSIEDLKSFLIWAKKERISAIKVQEIEVHFSTLAFVEEDASPDAPKSPAATEERNTSQTLMDEPMSKEEEEDLLFHSAR